MSQAIHYFSRIREYPRLRPPPLLDEADNRVYCSKFCTLGGTSLRHCPLGSPPQGAIMWHQSTSDSHQHTTLTVCRSLSCHLRRHTSFMTQYPLYSYLRMTSSLFLTHWEVVPHPSGLQSRFTSLPDQPRPGSSTGS